MQVSIFIRVLIVVKIILNILTDISADICHIPAIWYMAFHHSDILCLDVHVQLINNCRGVIGKKRSNQ